MEDYMTMINLTQKLQQVRVPRCDLDLRRILRMYRTSSACTLQSNLQSRQIQAATT
jgi:hypothetical protein